MHAESHATVLEMIRSKRCGAFLKQKTMQSENMSPQSLGDIFYSFELKAVG